MAHIIVFPGRNPDRISSARTLSSTIDNALSAEELLAAAEQLRDCMAVVTEYLETAQRQLSVP